MKTKSYNYINAVEHFNKAKEITKEELANYIKTGEGIQDDDFTSFSSLAIEARKRVQEVQYPYNSDVAEELLSMLNLSELGENEMMSRAERIVYNSNQYIRSVETIGKYRKMFNNGYIHHEDMTKDMDGKKAKLKGTKEIDYLRIQKDDEIVKIVCTDNERGYQRPRQRTRFFRFSLDSDMFIKLI